MLNVHGGKGETDKKFWQDPEPENIKKILCRDNMIDAILNAALRSNIKRDEEEFKTIFLKMITGILNEKVEDERKRQ